MRCAVEALRGTAGTCLPTCAPGSSRPRPPPEQLVPRAADLCLDRPPQVNSLARGLADALLASDEAAAEDDGGAAALAERLRPITLQAGLGQGCLGLYGWVARCTRLRASTCHGLTTPVLLTCPDLQRCTRRRR
jgi:hypothetical protein